MRWLVVGLRYLMALFFLGSSINKLRGEWLWSDASAVIFRQRLAELDPQTFGAAFLTNFAIPYHQAVSWVFTLTAISVTLSFALGLATRVGGALAVWLMIMIAIGGYYDASLLPLWLVAGLMIVCPSGQWFGLDKNLHARYPKSLWFR